MDRRFTIVFVWAFSFQPAIASQHPIPRYALREAAQKFDEAEFNCQATGMTLVKFDSVQEYNDVVQFVMTMKGYGKMIGSLLIGLKHDGQANATSNENFHWTDGTALATDLKCWLNGEPDLNPNKLCVSWSYNYEANPCEFKMAYCTTQLAYVCKDINYMSSPPTPIPSGSYLTPELFAATMSPENGVFSRFLHVHGTFNETGLIFTSQHHTVWLYEDCLAVCVSQTDCRRAAFEKNSPRSCHLYKD